MSPKEVDAVLLVSDGVPATGNVAKKSEMRKVSLQPLENLSRNVTVRLVALPSWELFELQDAEYREAVLPAAVTARVSIEAASTFGWSRYVGSAGASVGIDHFGASAPAKVLYKEFGITAENLVATALRVLGRS